MYGLINISISDRVTTIENQAFYEFQKLSSVAIGKV